RPWRTRCSGSWSRSGGPSVKPDLGVVYLGPEQSTFTSPAAWNPGWLGGPAGGPAERGTDRTAAVRSRRLTAVRLPDVVRISRETGGRAEWTSSTPPTTSAGFCRWIPLP